MIYDKSASSRLMNILVHVTMILAIILCILPVLHIASISVSSTTAINQGRVSLFPVEFTLDAYKSVFRSGKVPNGFYNSVIYMCLGTVINLVLTILTAYPLSKRKLPLRSFYTLLVTIPMFFSGGLIPNFLLINELGIYNKIWALVLPGAISTWNLIIMRTFFMNIPDTLEESAYLDGANDFQILFHIVLPLSLASIATIGMFYAVSHWNSWFNALIYLRDNSKYPLQLILREIVIQNSMSAELAETYVEDTPTVTAESIKYATLFISILPMLIIYPFVQKYFVKGVMVGSIKG